MNMSALPRTLEPEVMDDAEEARLYDEMDHSEVNRRFVDDFLKSLPADESIERVVDLGCGTALIPIELCRQATAMRVMALDAATEMLNVAVRNIDVAGLRNRIELVHADAKALDAFEDGMCDAVISNSLLHHLPEPLTALRQAKRLVRSGGMLFIRDLMRPQDAAEVDRLTELYAGNEPAASKQLLHQSLHAALTLDEIREMAGQLGIAAETIQATSDRHWTLAAKIE